MDEIIFKPFGDCAIMMTISQNQKGRLQLMAEQIENNRFDGLIEVVLGMTTITVYYNPFIIYQLCASKSPFEYMEMKLKEIVDNIKDDKKHLNRTVIIAVCYGGEFGPDLEDVANYHQLSQSEVIDLHANRDYVVHMIGFAPGFPYLGGLHEGLATPRKATPRTSIPVGSVGIGGEQTGVYPIESPGGWNLIGQTPLTLFNPDEEVPSLLRAGDIVRFQPITCEEFERLKEGC